MDNATGQRPPLVTRKMLIRFVIGLFAIAVLTFGYQWYRSLGGDIDLPFSVETAGLIAAIEEIEDGNQAVLIQPDGKLIRSPSYVKGASDRDIVWRPDGNRVFFSSDREEHVYNIYRWNPGSEVVQRRTFGSRAKSNVEFAPPDTPGANDTALITSGGFVLELNPTNGATPQLLPPIGREIVSGEEGGSRGQFDAIYQSLGSSFRRARWAGKGRSWIVAAMRRDMGEVLVLQRMDAPEGLVPPIPIVAGERVEFDVNPKTGEVVYVAIGFQFPDRESIPKEFIVDGRIKKPFAHVVGVVDPSDLRAQNAPVAASPDDTLAFTSPTISPDGNRLLLLTGKHVGSGQVEVKDMAVVPTRAGGGEQAARILEGRINDPSWAPDSQRVAFVMTEKGKRAVCEINVDGSGFRNITGQTGNFSRPRYSPQRKR